MIAVENVRLFNEMQTRNREVTESLNIKNRHPRYLPLLPKIYRYSNRPGCGRGESRRLCNSYDAVSRASMVICFADRPRGPGPLPVKCPSGSSNLNRDSVTGRAMLDKKTLHIHDLLAEPLGEIPQQKILSDSEQRTMLITPLIREMR